MKRFAIAPLAALGILAGAVPAARAADATCTTPIQSGTINGNLTVPAGADCELGEGGPVTVTGNVQVGKGAILTVRPVAGQMVTIGGNVQAAQCNVVSLLAQQGAISVGGNVQIRNCTFRSGYEAEVGNLTIDGNFACDNNSGSCLAYRGSVRGNVQINNNSFGFGPAADVEFNTVGGNVQVNNNAGAFVEGNTIGGNLRCAGNTPGVSGGGNTVTGNKQGQCAGL